MIDWILLLIGGLCEIGFVTMMKLSDGLRRIKYTILTILFGATSFYLLSIAMKTIPIGIGYGVWAGIGAIGSVLVGIFFFHENKSIKKIILMTMIIVGIVGLKLSTH